MKQKMKEWGREGDNKGKGGEKEGEGERDMGAAETVISQPCPYTAVTVRSREPAKRQEIQAILSAVLGQAG